MVNATNIDKSKSSKIFSNESGKSLWKILSSTFVPLLIGVATVLIAVIQLQIASKQRAQDLQIATEHRKQDLYIANTAQQNIVLASYIEQMSELMLSPNFTLNDTIVASICRAKTMLAIRQLDSKHKSHLIKFLYEARMIRRNQPHIDLADAEFDNIDLSGKYARYDRPSLTVMDLEIGANIVTLSEISFERTSLNNASFAHLKIQGGSFREASLIGANFTGSKIVSTSFVRAILRNADFRDVTHDTYLDFKSADLLGSNIADELLLNAISIEDAILPNGTRGTQMNLIVDGDAESSNCTSDASMPHSWSIKHISGNVSLSVASYLANPTVTYTTQSAIDRGRCFYAVRGQQGQVMMRQVVRPMEKIRFDQGNMYLTYILVCSPVKNISKGRAFVEFRVEQFDQNGKFLQNHTRGKRQKNQISIITLPSTNPH